MVPNSWIVAMYITSVLGAIGGMFWPVLLKAFKSGGGGQRAATGFLAEAYRTPVNSTPKYIGAAIIIAMVVSSLNFVAFTQTSVKDGLHSLGLLAYFAAFTYGFSAGSAIEEPLKK